MSTVTLQEAQSHLSELLERLGPGEEILITRDEVPVARLVAEAPVANPQGPRLGTLTGTVKYMAPDFDAPLE